MACYFLPFKSASENLTTIIKTGILLYEKIMISENSEHAINTMKIVKQ